MPPPLPARFGAVARLNAAVAGVQDGSSVAVLRDGTIVVAWTNSSAAAGDIAYRQFDARAKSTTLLDRTANAATAGIQEDAEVTALTGGGFALAWTDNALVGNPDVRARAFNPAGSATTGDIAVAVATGNQRQPDIVGVANGGFVVAWEEANSAISGVTNSAIMARGYGVGGAVLGAGPLRISGATAGVGGDATPALAANAAGFVGAWQDALPPDAAIDGIYGRGFSGSLLPGAVAGAPGHIDAGPTNAFMTDPDVALLAGGAQVTVWERRIQGAANGTEIMVTRAGTIAQANVIITGEQVNPAVAALAGGGFVVVWEDYSNGNANADIRMRVYDAAGVASTLDVLVPTAAAALGQQFNPDVAGLVDGRFIVTWSTLTSPGGNGTDIAAQIFDPRIAAQTWLGKTWGEQYVGTGFADSLNGAAGNDTLWGEAGADTLNGSTGNDTLDGGAGIDRLIGGPGDDVLIADATGDVVFEVRNQGTDIVHTTAASYILGANVENLVATNATAHSLTGNGLANRITGNAGIDTLTGAGGDDVLDGGAGGDRLVGGTDNDIYVVDSAADVVVEVANQGFDLIVATFGTGYQLAAAHVEGLLLAGAVVTGLGNALANSIGQLEADGLPGVPGSTAAGVTLHGLGGNDTLHGGTGDDVLIGGPGADLLIGDFFESPGGGDRFAFFSPAESTIAAPDTIADFHFGPATGNDRIDLRGIDADPTLTGDQAFTYIGPAGFPAAGHGWLRVTTIAPGLHRAEGDIDGNGAADFAIAIVSDATPAASWFLR